MTPTAAIPPEVRAEAQPRQADPSRRAGDPGRLDGLEVTRDRGGSDLLDGRFGHRGLLSASSGARSGAVTWRKSSSRSLAARAKLAIGSPARTESASSRADAASSPRNPSSIVPSSRMTADATSGSAREPVPRGLEGLAVGDQPDAEHGPEAESSLDVRDATLGQHLAAIDDRDAGAQLLELGQDVAADEDRLAQRAQFAEQLAKLDPCPRVEAGGGLVEEQDLGVVDERVRQAEPLLHAARQRLDVLVALVAEVDELEEVADHASSAGRRDAVAASEEVEVLPDLHVVVDPEHVRHEPDDAPHLIGVPGHRPARDLGLPGRRTKERGEHAQDRGLAGAVGPDQPEDLTGLDRQVDAGHRQRAVVPLDQALGPQDGGHRTSPVMDRSKLKPTPSLRSFTNLTTTLPEVGST